MDALPPFNPDSALRQGTVSLVIGHRNAGKTWLVRHLLERGPDPPTRGLWITGSERPRLPPTVTHFAEEFNPDLLASFTEERQAAGPGADPAFAVFDDCIYDPSTIFRDRAFRALLERSRTWNLRVTLTMLYAMGIPPSLRACVDFVFLFREALSGNCRRIYDMWFAGRPNYDLDLVRQLLQEPYRCEYDCLVLDTQTDRLFRYRVLPSLLRSLPPQLPRFDPATELRPGDLCVCYGAGYKTPVLTAFVRAARPWLCDGYIESRETIVPFATGNYASLQNQTAVYAPMDGGRSTALANFLLDVSGPSFVLLDDWFDREALPYRFLWAHRRERQLLTLVATPLAPAPDFQLFFNPGCDRHRSIDLPPEIPLDWLLSLDYLAHECLVFNTRTRTVQRFIQHLNNDLPLTG
jgi:hypothetical protein